MFYFNGQSQNIPGVYGIQKVVEQNGTIFPTFNIGLIIAKSMKGTPYTGGTKGSEKMLAYNDATAVARDYGYDDIYEMFKQAQKGGAGTIFLMNIQPNTGVSANFLDDSDGATYTTGDPIFIVTAKPKMYGVFGNDIGLGITDTASDVLCTLANTTKFAAFSGLATGTATAGASTTLTCSTGAWTSSSLINAWVKITAGTGVGQTRRIVSNTSTVLTVAAWTTNPSTDSVFQIVRPKWQLTIVPTKNEKMLTQNVTSGNNYMYVNNNVGLSKGAIIGLMANTGFIGNYEIADVSTTYNSSLGGYKVVLTTPISSSAATLADYARIEQIDSDNAINTYFTDAEWKVDNIVAVMNKAQDGLLFSKHASASATYDPAWTSGNYYLGQISGATKGTNPAASSTNYSTVADAYPDWSDEFVRTNKVTVRHIALGTSDAAVHAIYKSLSTTMKGMTYKRPLQIWSGAALDDSVSALIARGAALNSDSIVCVACGLEGRPAYLSLAPQIFGLTLNSQISHNLTRDLIDCTVVEKEWSRVEQNQLTAAGIMTIAPKSTGYKIIQGLNTYQNHSQVWNEQDNQTYLCHQRQLADFWHIGIMETLDEQTIGADGIDKDRIIGIVNSIGTRYRDEGLITSFRLLEVKKTDLGHTVRTEVLLPGVNDFIGITNNIIANQPA